MVKITFNTQYLIKIIIIIFHNKIYFNPHQLINNIKIILTNTLCHRILIEKKKNYLMMIDFYRIVFGNIIGNNNKKNVYQINKRRKNSTNIIIK